MSSRFGSLVLLIDLYRVASFAKEEEGRRHAIATELGTRMRRSGHENVQNRGGPDVTRYTLFRTTS